MVKYNISSSGKTTSYREYMDSVLPKQREEVRKVNMEEIMQEAQQGIGGDYEQCAG